MDIKATKLDLMQLLLQINEESVLKRVKSILEEESSDWWDELSDEEKEDIALGLQDVENGDMVDYEEVKKLFRK